MTLQMHYQEKYEQGLAQGRTEGEFNIIILYNWLKKNGRDMDAEAIMKKENETLRASLYAEYDKTPEEW